MSEPNAPLPAPNLPNRDLAREKMLTEYERTQEERRRNKRNRASKDGVNRVEQIILLGLGVVVLAALAWSAWLFGQRVDFGSLAAEINLPGDELGVRLRQDYPMPEFKPLNTGAVDWSTFPTSVIPETLMVNRPVEYVLTVNGKRAGVSQEKAGHYARVVQRGPEGLVLTINPQNSLLATVSPFDTSAGAQLESYYKAEAELIKGRVTIARDLAEQVLTRPHEPGDPKVQADGYSDPSAMIFQPVHAYLLDGRLPGRQFKDIKRWGWLGKQRIDDEVFDVVVIFFQVPSPFGPTAHAMKCLLQQQNVRKWVDPSVPPAPEA